VHELLHHAAANSAVKVIMQWRWLRSLGLLLSSRRYSVAGDDRFVGLVANLAAVEAVLQPLAEESRFAGSMTAPYQNSGRELLC
jgi:hypothetical protein